MRELSNNKHQTYKVETKGKTPTQLQIELEKMGVRGFVVKIDKSKVTMLIKKCDADHNREAIK